MYYDRILSRWVFTLYDKILLYALSWHIFLNSCYVFYLSWKKKIKKIQGDDKYTCWDLEHSLALLDSYNFSLSTTQLRCLQVYFMSIESDWIFLPQFTIDIRSFGFLTKDLAEFEFEQRRSNHQSIFRHLTDIINIKGGSDTNSSNPPQLSPAEQTNQTPQAGSQVPVLLPPNSTFQIILAYIKLFMRQLILLGLKYIENLVRGKPRSNTPFAHHLVQWVANKYIEFLRALSQLVAPPGSSLNNLTCAILGLICCLLPIGVNIKLIYHLPNLPALVQLFLGTVGGTVLAIQSSFLLFVFQQFGMEGIQYLAGLLPVLLNLLKRRLEEFYQDPRLFENFNLTLPDLIKQTTFSDLYANFLDKGKHQPLDINNTSTRTGYVHIPEDLKGKPPLHAPVMEPEDVVEPMPFSQVNQEDIKNKINNYLTQDLDNPDNITNNKDKLIE